MLTTFGPSQFQNKFNQTLGTGTRIALKSPNSNGEEEKGQEDGEMTFGAIGGHFNHFGQTISNSSVRESINSPCTNVIFGHTF